MASKTSRRIEALAAVARDVLSRRFSPDCCVAATRAGLDVLTGWGVEAEPRFVKACAVNRPWINGSRDPDIAYMVMIDCEDAPDHKIAGHLVIATRNRLIDLSAWQFDRPERGIHVASGLVLTSGRELRIALPGGGAVAYGRHPHPESTRWMSAPDWTLPFVRHQEQHRMLVQELRAAAELAADGRTSWERTGT
jgi:hypothetical protein